MNVYKRVELKINGLKIVLPVRYYEPFTLEGLISKRTLRFTYENKLFDESNDELLDYNPEYFVGQLMSGELNIKKV